MFKNLTTLKEVKEDYYLIPKSLKSVTISGVKIDIKNFYEVCKTLDYFENDSFFDDNILKNGYVCYSNNDKKVPKEIEDQIKNDTGSIRKLAKKYGYGVGTIHKIKNNTYR